MHEVFIHARATCAAAADFAVAAPQPLCLTHLLHSHTICHLLFVFTFFIIQISRVQKMLGDEYGTASNIKSRVNRLSVLGAITSAQQRLKLYNKVLPGSGTAQTSPSFVSDHV